MSIQTPIGRSYKLPIRTYTSLPNDDAQGVTEELIGSVVVEFYSRVRLDAELGPVFDTHIADWPEHLDRMVDFWSAALLKSGRYTGNPVESHRRVESLSAGHFDRWITLFEQTVRDVCPLREAEAFLLRALRMREGLMKALQPDPRGPSPRP
ncbi:MAG TPA: group III truncated hemoglobin [Isosphaeraceae bacterium]|nr:group III truncated hemoglobin [Isosphaeraceae bacterium]